MFELMEGAYAQKTNGQLIREQRERIHKLSKKNYVMNNKKLFSTTMSKLNKETLTKFPIATISEKLDLAEV